MERVADDPLFGDIVRGTHPRSDGVAELGERLEDPEERSIFDIVLPRDRMVPERAHQSAPRIVIDDDALDLAHVDRSHRSTTIRESGGVTNRSTLVKSCPRPSVSEASKTPALGSITNVRSARCVG